MPNAPASAAAAARRGTDRCDCADAIQPSAIEQQRVRHEARRDRAGRAQPDRPGKQHHDERDVRRLYERPTLAQQLPWTRPRGPALLRDLLAEHIGVALGQPVDEHRQEHCDRDVAYRSVLARRGHDRAADDQSVDRGRDPRRERDPLETVMQLRRRIEGGAVRGFGHRRDENQRKVMSRSNPRIAQTTMRMMTSEGNRLDSRAQRYRSPSAPRRHAALRAGGARSRSRYRPWADAAGCSTSSSCAAYCRSFPCAAR